MTFDTFNLVATGVLGFVAGIVGGLAGVGGSLVMIPGLHFIHGDDPASVHHLYMASAMAVNVTVALPAVYQHSKAGAVRRDLLPTSLASATLAMLGGVLLSNRIEGDHLRTLLGVAIVLYCGYLALRVARNAPDPEREGERTTNPRIIVSAALAGFTGGLLGLGGGVVLVPMFQALCRMKLREAIATSSAVICVTATIGAVVKLATLHGHDQQVGNALLLAGLLAPTAIIGARLGAKLTHVLPLQWVRVAIIAFLLLAALRLMGAW